MNCPACGHELNGTAKKPLTRRQAEVLNYIKGYIADEGIPPSFHEIRTHFGLTSIATVWEHVKNLADHGYITTRYNHGRSIVVNE